MGKFISALALVFASQAFALGINGLKLDELNQVISTLDQVKLAKSFRVPIILNEKTRLLEKFETNPGMMGSSGLRCIYADLSLENVTCKVVGFELWVPEGFKKPYGEYFVGRTGYEAICEAVPGEWSTTYISKKPPYRGIQCEKQPYSGH